MANFFIDRPIFAWVLAIILCLAGVLSLFSLPIEQYPNLAPPKVRINASYPGASAEMLYMSAQSSNTGKVSVTLTFQAGSNPSEAMTQVQNQLQFAIKRLPQDVQQQGISVSKSGDNTLMMLAFVSTDGSMNKQDIADYVASNLQDPLSRIQGVGSVDVYGSQYAMRIWLDPGKLNKYHLTAQDIVAAIKSQNRQVAVGQLGGTPAVATQALNAVINAQSQLQTPEQFDAITLRVNQDGSVVTLGNVAKVELGAEKYDYLSRFNGQTASGLGIKLASGANQLQTDALVKKRLAELAPFFPRGLEAKIAYETSSFVKASIQDVIETLLEAVLLVFLVMYLFLQNFRATLIPTIAVPIVLLGTVAILFACGFSINTLTLFAIVLAIGLLVDDAIVVVENVERIMSEEGLGPREATRKSMGQIQGALIGIALVLSAVFVPMAFFGGTTGAIYRQFSITIVSAMGLSVLVALILTPALCATLLKPIAKGQYHKKNGFFAWFNHMFDRNTGCYETAVKRVLHRGGYYIILYLLLLTGLIFLFFKLPSSFLPQEDRGVFTAQVQLPVGATQQQTLKIVEKVEHYFLSEEQHNLLSVFSTIGAGSGGNGQNVARLFIRLKNWQQRSASQNSSFAIIERANKAFNKISSAKISASSPAAISGLGNSAGFVMELQDHGGLGHNKLTAARDQLLQLATQQPQLTKVRHNGLDDSPQLQINIDQHKALALGVSLDAINNTLKTAWGSTYVNDFIDRGRVKKVYVQSEAKARMLPEDIYKWYLPNKNGSMVPFSAFSTTHWEYGPPRLERYNGYSSLEITGEAASGVSSGSAMNIMEKLVDQLPHGFGLEWTGMSYQERLSGSQAPALYVVSLLVVFLCLAALYESWSIPFCVMLVVPLGVIGAVSATWLRGLENDIYFQVGLLTITGLSAKNAILIIEFANNLNNKNQDLLAATLEACRQRLRPILMTSLAFIFGVLPMAISQGAGSGSQHAVGTGVTGGMISATILAIFFVPLFFVLIKRRFPGKIKL